MATSPNYSWPEPDDTSLVKNGALAIRTLGNAIDTTMGTMVAKTIIDAKGDLIAGTAADTAARLPVGANGQTLVADSSTSTGLRYQGNTAAGKNAFINSAFDVWQRGTSFASSAATYNLYTADRYPFNFGLATTATLSRQLTNDTTNLPFIQYCARAQRNSGATTVANMAFNYTLENSDSNRFIGQTVTFSFYARAGANYSSASNALFVRVASGTGTDQSIASGLTGQTDFITQTATLTTTWQRFSYTGTVSAAAKQIGFYVFYTTSGTAGASDFFETTGFQMELGSVATAFARNSGTIQGELAACQRYYFRFGGDVTYQTLGFGTANGTTTAAIMLNCPVPMRIAPSSVDFSTLALQTQQTGAVNALTTLTIASSQNGRNAVVLNAGGSGGLTTGQPQVLLTNNSTSGFVGLSAEL